MKRTPLSTDPAFEGIEASSTPVSISAANGAGIHTGTNDRPTASKHYMGNGPVATRSTYDLDYEAIVECCAGRKQAFTDVVLRHKDRLYTVALQLLGDSGDAEDVTQDTFLRAYEKLAEFRGHSQFSTWLYRICHNLCMNRLAKKKTAQQDRFVPETVPFQTEHLLDQLIIKERQVLVNRAIAQLPMEFREVLILYHTGQLSYEETAHLLELPVGTVRSRLHRGREQLKELLRPYLQEDA
ncbi:MAG: RNA polymerase sigma factor [Candidatus Binatia bacterium]